MRSRKACLTLLFIVLLALDQLSKVLVQSNMVVGESRTVIKGLFNITYVFNPGAAFGIFNSQPEMFRKIFFIGITVVACALIIYLIYKDYNYRLRTISYVMILAGAVGNFIDRVRMGMVVDFLDVYWKNWHWYTFNIADCCITFAVGLLLWEMFLNRKKDKIS